MLDFAHLNRMQKIHKCKKCSLCFKRKQVVDTNRINFNSEGLSIYCISYHPSLSDETLGKFSKGPAQEFLIELIVDSLPGDSFLESIYISGLIRCVPKTDRLGNIREPRSIELLKCSSWMHKEIEAIKPDLILFVGKEVESYCKKEYKESLTIPNTEILIKQGGTASPYYPTLLRTLKERLKNDKKKTIFEVG